MVVVVVVISIRLFGSADRHESKRNNINNNSSKQYQKKKIIKFTVKEKKIPTTQSYHSKKMVIKSGHKPQSKRYSIEIFHLQTNFRHRTCYLYEFERHLNALHGPNYQSYVVTILRVNFCRKSIQFEGNV